MYAEKFDANRYNWQTFYNDVSFEIKNGELTFSSDDDGYVGLVNCLACTATDNTFYFQAELYPEQATDVLHGISFCMNGYKSDYFVFQVDAKNKLYSLYKNQAEGDWSMIYNDLPAKAILHSPEHNILGVYYDRGRMDLYVNGTKIQTYQYPDLLVCKQIGLFVNGSGANIHADNVFMYKVKPATATSKP